MVFIMRECAIQASIVAAVAPPALELVMNNGRFATTRKGRPNKAWQIEIWSRGEATKFRSARVCGKQAASRWK